MRRLYDEKTVRVVVNRAMAPPLGLRNAFSPNETVVLSKGEMSHDAVTHNGRRGDVSAAMSPLSTTSSCDSTSALP